MAGWQTDARRAAQRYGFDPAVFVAQMDIEAHGADLTSPAGAQGPAQFMPGTARSVGLTPATVHQRVPAYNAAAKLMAGYVRQYGSVKNALIAYNAGPGRIGGSLPAETQAYIKNIMGASSSQPRSSPRAPAAAPASDPVSQMTAAATTGDGGPRTDATSLISLASQSRQRPAGTGGLPTPAAMAGPALPQGYQALAATHGPAPRQDVGALINAALTPGASGAVTPTANASTVPASSGGGKAASRTPAAYRGTYPLGARGQVIGTPYSGTHTLGNWQSDNAVDIRIPEGTPMVALQSGVVVKVRHHPQDGGRFAGDQITIRGTNGNEYFYAHGVADVKPGQKIRRGQPLGVTGSANGVPHLHFGQMRGDPRSHAR